MMAGTGHERGIERFLAGARWCARAVNPDRFWGITSLVTIWWLSIALVVTTLLPAPASSAAPGEPFPTPGRAARVNQHQLGDSRIPVERDAFEEFQRGLRESDEEAIERALSSSAWIVVQHGQAVRVLTVDGAAVQIVVLDGLDAGRRAWVPSRYLYR